MMEPGAGANDDKIQLAKSISGRTLRHHVSCVDHHNLQYASSDLGILSLTSVKGAFDTGLYYSVETLAWQIFSYIYIYIHTLQQPSLYLQEMFMLKTT